MKDLLIEHAEKPGLVPMKQAPASLAIHCPGCIQQDFGGLVVGCDRTYLFGDIEQCVHGDTGRTDRIFLGEHHILRYLYKLAHHRKVCAALRHHRRPVGHCPRLELCIHCCFSKRMRNFFRKNEKSVLQFCNKKPKRKGRLQRVEKSL